MAPKKAAAKPDKAKAKTKTVEDATFGMKNKNKSAKVQKYVQSLQKQVQNDANKRKQQDPEQLRKERKAAEEAKKKEMQDLLVASIIQPKVPPGVDPKSILCEFFRHGACTKGTKCKFAHNLAVERKGPKIDIFSDRRGAEEDGPPEGMADWDQEKLESVVKQKHGAEKQANNETQIICKFFLEAVEKKLYGWFWQCPNGPTCKYRHALPPGYVLKSQMKELLEEEAANRRDVAEVIEEERAKVDAKTPITQEVFAKWHAERAAARLKAATEKEAERRKAGVLTGREIFQQEGFVAQDDASAQERYEREGDAEADIALMHADAARAAEEARRAEGLVGGESEAGPSAPKPSNSGTSASTAIPPADEAGPSGAILTAQEEEALFGDDDDDDDDDDLDDDDLDALEATLGKGS